MRLVSKLALTLALPALLIFMVGQASAQIQVNGEVFGEWNLDDSPVEVTGDISLPFGETLNIEAGVVVRFQGPYAFRIFGVLNAEGNLRDDNETIDWITFTQDTAGVADDSGLWRGLRFDNSETGSDLEYCIIEFANAHSIDNDPEFYNDGNGGGIFIFGCSPRVENVIIRDCKAQMNGGAIYLWSTSSLIRNVLIVRNQAQLYGGGIYMDKSYIELRNLTMLYNEAGLGDQVAGRNYGGGIFYGPDTDPYIRSSILWRNGDQTENSPNDDYLSAENNLPNSFLKFVIVSQISTDIDNFIYQEDPDFVDEIEFRLEETSRGVDGGEYADDRYQNEPLPNGGRINMGIWGGTPRATWSVPVAQAAQYNINFFNVRPSDSAMVRIASILNIGHNDLEYNFDDAYLSNISMHPDSTQYDPADIQLFEIIPFPDYTVVPDSSADFNVTYMLDPSDFADDFAYLRVPTNGGEVEFRLRGVPFDPLINIPVTNINFDTLYMADYDSVNYAELPDSYTTRTFQVENVGHTRLELRDDPWMPTASGNVKAPRIGTARFILPDSSVLINVNYPQEDRRLRPYDYGLILDTVEVGSNDVIKQVAVRMFVYGAVLERAEEDSLMDFEYVNMNSPRTLNINLKNRGNIDIRIDSLQFSNSDFSTNIANGTIIAAGDSMDVGIVLEPSSLQLYDDLCIVHTTGASGDQVTFQLIGRGTSGGVYFSGSIPSQFIPEVWGENGETVYICAGPTTIPVGQKIVMKKGIEILFEGENWLQVEGELQVYGTEAEPVRFSPLDDSPDASFGGLRFVACDPASKINWAIIDRASTIDDSVDQIQLSATEHGGGISVYNCSPSFYGVTVSNCFSHFDGGGMWIYQSSPSIIRCKFINNTATTNGGGISLRGSEPLFIANVIKDNVAHLDGGGIYFQYYSEPVVANSILMNNTADGFGGGFFAFNHSSPIFLNDIIYENEATGGAASIRSQARSIPILRNSVVWSHSGDHISNVEGGSLVARYSIVENKDNFVNVDFDESVIDTDPMFDGDFLPLTDSPLIDGGNPGSLYEDYSFPPSLGTETNDMGITGGQYAGYWDGNPLHISLFTNSASHRYIDIIVNAVASDPDNEIVGVPQLVVSDWQGSETYAPETISDGVYHQPVEIDESSYLEIFASATTVSDQVVKIRRNLSVALFKPSQGGVLTEPGGSQLVLPPSVSSSEMLLTAEADLGASSPDEVELAAPVSMRWNINSSREQWNCEGELILNYDPRSIREGQELALAIWQNCGNEWTQLESYINPVTHTVHATVNSSGTFAIFRSGDEYEAQLLPSTTVLGSNYPNPFNPTTTIPFALSQSGKVELNIFNVLGQEIASLTNDWYTAGQHQLIWNGRDFNGVEMSSGVYFYRLRTFNSDGSDMVVHTRKLVLMR